MPRNVSLITLAFQIPQLSVSISFGGSPLPVKFRSCPLYNRHEPQWYPSQDGVCLFYYYFPSAFLLVAHHFLSNLDPVHYTTDMSPNDILPRPVFAYFIIIYSWNEYFTTAKKSSVIRLIKLCDLSFLTPLCREAYHVY